MDSFAIPRAAAALFTVGIYGIKRAEKHAEMLTHILLPVAMTLFMLLMIGGLQRAQDAQHTPPESHQAHPSAVMGRFHGDRTYLCSLSLRVAA